MFDKQGGGGQGSIGMKDEDGYRIKCLNVDLLVLVQVYTCLILMKEKILLGRRVYN